jgi:DNA polymerase-1
MEHYMEQAVETGEIRTILGRRSQFNLWEPVKWDSNSVPLPYERAVAAYGRVRRAQTHKALNRLLQGSAADMMKMAMLKCYEDGIFDETGVPRLTVHDELDFSDPGGKDEAFGEMQHIMETALPLRIPVKADGEIGPNWGDLRDI